VRAAGRKWWLGLKSSWYLKRSSFAQATYRQISKTVLAFMRNYLNVAGFRAC
jgi:hypothetical protein